jgi:hypothetical protein
VHAYDRGEDVVLDRRVRLVLCRGPRPTWSRPRLGHPRRGRQLGRGARRPAAAADGGGHRRHWPPCGTIPSGTPPWTGGGSSTSRWSRSTPGRPAISGWTTRRTGASPAAWPTCATRPTTTATPARSRGSWPSSTWDGARCSRSSTPGWCRSRRRGELLPRGQRAAAHRPAARSAITQPEGPSFDRRREPGALAEVVAAGRPWTPSRAWSSHRRLRGRRAGAARCCSGPRSARWWCPTAIPGPMHSWKSAFDAGEWGLGRMANSLTLGCDCLGEITYLDDVFSDERGKPTPGPTPSACTRRTTGSSGSTSTCRRAAPRCAGRAAWSSAPSPRWATTSTASTGTSTSTAPCSSR